jgi:hypothetical protein
MLGIVKTILYVYYVIRDKDMNYKAHIFASIGNGKLHTSRTQCGRHLHRNSRGTFVLDTKRFMEFYEEDPNLVCEKCLEKLKK